MHETQELLMYHAKKTWITFERNDMIKPNKRILFAVECQQVADVVNSKITGTIRAGHSWVIQANFPGMRNPNFELL